MTQEFMGLILLSDDISREIEYQSMNIPDEFLRIFEREEFKIEDSHEVIMEAYIASEKIKTIIIAAQSFNIFAQNALLKVIEEPPNNIRFILIAKNKTSLLATIRSRLPLQDKRKRKNPRVLEIDLKRLTIKDIYDFLKSFEEKTNISREEIKEKIQALFFLIKEYKIKISENELKSFDEALIANQNYQKDIYLFLPLLLMILAKNKSSQKLDISKVRH